MRPFPSYLQTCYVYHQHYTARRDLAGSVDQCDHAGRGKLLPPRHNWRWPPHSCTATGTRRRNIPTNSLQNKTVFKPATGGFIRDIVRMHLLLRPRSATPLLLGTRRPPLSIDISYPRGAWQQTRHTQELPSIDGTDRQTYGQTDGHQTVTETLLSILFEQRQIAHLSI